MDILIKKILDTSGLVPTTILNTKITVVENKTLNTSRLASTTVLNTKISEFEYNIPDNYK